MKILIRYWYVIAAFLIIVAAGLVYFGMPDNRTTAEKLPEVVDYNFHIRPILSDRCFKCHGPDGNKRKADLRLDTEAGLYQALQDEPNNHVIVPGKPMESGLFQRLISDDTSQVMPPPGSLLTVTDFEKQLIRKWISQGAKYQKHWAFIPPTMPEMPESDEWVSNEIDLFTLETMKEKGLEPNSVADPERLLKRVSFDITGLPPTIELQERFLKDPSAENYTSIVDELLSLPQYGEKMAVHWLDVARYADSHGYQDDGLRTMWPWRDWVIHAFNQNYPYDKFLTWQLAGDLLPDPNMEMLLATGFNRNHKITQEGGVIDEEYRVEYVTDRTNTFGKAFLALTFECAKCHDHKYDPISQKEYFSTFAFFNQVNEKGLVGDISLASLADPPRITITNEDVKNILTFINKKEKDPVQVMVMKDSAKVRPTYVLVRGAYDAHGDTVDFAVPDAIHPYDAGKFSKNRLGLARWLTDKQHPLTSRVFVNRIWQEFFGQGIVKTSGDFGMQGELPSHPELLDWLAIDFVENGWNIKRLVRQIVLSSTYKQSADVPKKKLAIDPDNRYLSRAPRIRLQSEHVKDHVLASSGLLVKEIGGPSVKPYQPDGIWELSTSGRGVLANYVQDHGDKLYRRGMYNFIKRTVPPPVMLMFDASNRDQCEVKRVSTNTPLQALIMMNDPMVLEASRVLAQRLMNEKLSDEDRISQAFRRIVCRRPDEKELQVLTSYFDEEKKFYSSEPEQADARLTAGEYPQITTDDKAATAALMQVISTMYNLDEAITR